jgi:hypothetical protein
MAQMKSSCGNYAKALVDKLPDGFPNHEFLSTLGFIYPKFWAQNFDNVGDGFHQCLIIIKATYYNLCKVGKDGVRVKTLLDGQLLDSQCFFKKLIMAANSELILKKNYDVNLMIQLWAKISSSTIFKLMLSKFIN